MGNYYTKNIGTAVASGVYATQTSAKNGIVINGLDGTKTGINTGGAYNMWICWTIPNNNVLI